jgi:hypothetical protein
MVKGASLLPGLESRRHYRQVGGIRRDRWQPGYGLCVWLLGRVEEAEHIFERMLWLNPSDNQGARFLLNSVKDRKEWEPEED